MTDERVLRIKDCAQKLFITEGYARTQIRHIAKEAGISVGAVYLLFESKRAILDFVLKCGIDPAFAARDIALPVREGDFPGLQNELMAAFYKKGIELAEPLTANIQGYYYADLLSDAYDILCEYGACALIFENNPDSCGRLGPFYVQYRARFMDTFLRFIHFYIENGQLRAPAQPELSVKLMIETLYYWAARVQYARPAEPDFPAEARKAVCIDALLTAYRAK